MLNFLIAGTAKAGTTSLSDSLSSHEKIHIPGCKELHFFDDYNEYRKGKKYYEKNFENRKINGEASPSYLSSPGCCRRIKKQYPNTKIIIVLRNPIERAYSNYRFSKQFGKFKGNFIEEIKRGIVEYNESYKLLIHPGFYGSYIRYYIDNFGVENLMIIKFEKMIRDEKSTLNRVQDFLGVKSEIEVLPHKNKTNKEPKSDLHAYVMKKIRELSKKSALKNLVPNKVKRGFKKNMIRIATKKDENKSMKKESRKILSEIYYSDINILRSIVDFRVDDWGIK